MSFFKSNKSEKNEKISVSDKSFKETNVQYVCKICELNRYWSRKDAENCYDRCLSEKTCTSLGHLLSNISMVWSDETLDYPNLVVIKKCNCGEESEEVKVSSGDKGNLEKMFVFIKSLEEED